MKRVLIISTVKLRYDGITSVIYNYCSHMDLKSLELNFIAINEVDKELLNKFNSLGKVYKVANRKESLFKYINNITKILKTGYDVVHVHGNSATMVLELFLSKLNKIPIRIAHCHNSTCTYKLLNNILKPIFYHTYTHALACSELAGKWLFGVNNFMVLHNAINLEKYEFLETVRCQYRNSLMISENTLVIGHVGNFTEQKNHDFLIDIFYELQKSCDAILLLIGEGALQEIIKQKVVNLGIDKKVIFLNVRDDVENLMQAMDVFVFPSKWEGLGMVLIEAQALGLRCVVSDRVPKEADVTGDISYISLNVLYKDWVEIINKKYKDKTERQYIFEKVKTSAFNIEHSIKILEKIYMG